MFWQMKSFFKWLVRPPEKQSWLYIIKWWELRRIPYNLIVGLMGIVSLGLFFLFINLAHELKPGEDAVEPVALMFAPIAINVLYTGGWITELFLRIICRWTSSYIGPVLFGIGILFSICAIFFPSALWFVIWIVRAL